jgi:hypothetical protein
MIYVDGETTPNQTKDIIEQGKAALKRIIGRTKFDFLDWMKVGAGIRKGNWIVAKSLRMNAPDSKRQIFSRACKAWRARNGYGAIDQRKDARVVLYHLSWIMDHEKEFSRSLWTVQRVIA